MDDMVNDGDEKKRQLDEQIREGLPAGYTIFAINMGAV